MEPRNHRVNLPIRRSSFQQAKSAILQKTDRIRKKSIGKVQPLQETLAQLPVQKRHPSPEARRFQTLPENEDISDGNCDLCQLACSGESCKCI